MRILNNNEEVSIDRAIEFVYPSILNRSMKKNNGNIDLAKDLTQEVILKILEKNDNDDLIFSTLNKFKNYFLFTTDSLFIDNKRSLSRKKEVSYDNIKSGVSHIALIPDGDQDFLQKIVEEEITELQTNAAILAFQELHEDQKLVMKMRVNGKSFNEIQEITGLSVNTLLGQARYARIKMRKFIKNYVQE